MKKKVILLLDFGLKLRKAEKDVYNLTRTNGLNFFLGYSFKLLFGVKIFGNENESHPSA
jgi:hypothetical protein